MGYKEVMPEDIIINPFKRIGSDWMLITAGNKDSFNMMTASWGGMGILWRRNVVTIYIRPQRYTKEFVEANETFTISFYPPEYKKVLSFCGSVSGRDYDKVKETGLTPYFIDNTVAFAEADLIMICRKLYQDNIVPENFIDKECDTICYPEKDYHTMYMAEVMKVLVKE